MTAFSYQLYSSREFPPLEDTLAMLRGLGYEQVEGYGGVYGDAAALRAALDRNGLAMPSGHFGLDMLEDNPGKVIEIARITGMKAVFCPHIGPELRPDSAAGWADFGRRLAKAGEPIMKAGFTYGWHNHDFELRALADGSVPLAHLLDAAPELAWEADIAWVARGGADPLEWIARYGDRLAAVHVKDIAPAGEKADEDGWEDVGHGTMPWTAIWATLKNTPVDIFVMEHDKPSDHERFARRSIEAARSF